MLKKRLIKRLFQIDFQLNKIMLSILFMYILNENTKLFLMSLFLKFIYFLLTKKVKHSKQIILIIPTWRNCSPCFSTNTGLTGWHGNWGGGTPWNCGGMPWTHWTGGMTTPPWPPEGIPPAWGDTCSICGANLMGDMRGWGGCGAVTMETCCWEGTCCSLLVGCWSDEWTEGLLWLAEIIFLLRIIYIYTILIITPNLHKSFQTPNT